MNSLPQKPKLRLGVIASIVARTFEEFLAAWEASSLAHSREIRLDPLWDTPHLKQVLEALSALIDKEPHKSVILTLRTDQDGGKHFISVLEQYQFWRDAMPEDLHQKLKNPKSNVFTDWPIGLVMFVKEQFAIAPFPWNKIGGSIHIFEPIQVPNSVEGHVEMFKSLIASPAYAFKKYVPLATDREDVILLHLWEALGKFSDAGPIIAFWMGKRGENSRRECMGHGSDGVFGYIPGFGSAAPGQLSINELLREKLIIEAMTPTVRGVAD